MINTLNIDPGLGRFGAVLVQTDGREHEAISVDVFVSELRADDFDINLAEDRVRRTRQLARWLKGFCAGFDIQLVAAEAMSFPRGAHAITAMCLAWGVVASFLEDRRLPLISAMPSYWRTCLIGPPPPRKGITAAQRKIITEQRERAAHAKAMQVLPSAAPKIRALPTNEHQLHALDSCGVFAWSTMTSRFRDVLRGVG